MAEETRRGGVLGKIIIVVIIVAIGVAGFVFFGKNKNTNSIVDSGKYQAVFLTNGQTYFGKVSNEKSAYVSLSDVYYLVLKKPLQNQQQDGDQPQEQPKSEYSLVKLGKEMHGPISMSINKDQILFIENLADDSKVVSTIKNQK